MAPSLSPRPVKLTFSRDQWNRLKETTRTDLLSRCVDDPERTRAWVSFHVSPAALLVLGQAFVDLSAEQNLDIDFWDGTADCVAFRYAQLASEAAAKANPRRTPFIAAVPPAVEAEIVEADMSTIDDEDDDQGDEIEPAIEAYTDVQSRRSPPDQLMKGGR